MRRTAVAAVLAAALLGGAPAHADAKGAVTAKTRTIDAGGLTFGYRTIGSGPPVVLVMGLSGTMDGWDPTFVDAIAQAGHRVVLFDNEGIGKSEARPGKLTIRRMGDNTARLIKALGLERPDVVGWSMGGMIAQSLAVNHPRSLRRLVLLATAPGDGKGTPPSAQGAGSLNDAATAGGALFPPGQEQARDRFFANIAKRKNLNPRAPGPVVQAQIAAAGAWLTGQDADGRKITRLRMPTLVGGGGKDQLLPVANQRHLGRTIPKAQTVIYSDAAHGFFLQRSDDFLPRLRRFLRRQRATAGAARAAARRSPPRRASPGR